MFHGFTEPENKDSEAAVASIYRGQAGRLLLLGPLPESFCSFSPLGLGMPLGSVLRPIHFSSHLLTSQPPVLP